ncbi:MAG TPA: hypothetical protein VNA68_00185 [Candidatus Dormibacteraeota bacterium]|nr:hypothetical protein [Candidatus Dormibacteraeota bacterium]
MKKFLTRLISAGSVALIPAIALAQPQCEGAQAVGGTCGEGALTGYISNLINMGFYLAGTIAVVILIIGGIGYIGSTGDPARITKAKNTILYAVIGLIVTILAYAIVGFVIGRL